MSAGNGKVLVVEDEAPLRDAMVTFLRMDGLDAVGAGTLAEAGMLIARHAPDLLVLDLGLPDGDGLDWLRQQPASRRGVVITTARGRAEERVDGMQAGADAYLVKPVQLEELSLLVQKLMGRVLSAGEAGWTLSRINWTLQAPSGESIKLTRLEALVMQRLAETPGEAVSKDELAICLGQRPETYDMRRLEILVRRLRAKARDSLDVELPVDTAHRLGYAFTARIVVQ